MSTTNATSTGDPVPICGSNVGKGVWFYFQSPSDGNATISTCGSDFDTVLQVYSGGCGSLFPVACNDSFGPSCPGLLQASVQFDASAGTAYFIFVGGNNGASGTLFITNSFCEKLVLQSTTNGYFLDASGFHGFFIANVTGSPIAYFWTFFDDSFNVLFTTNSTVNTVVHTFGPFDQFPASFNVTFSSGCTNGGGGGGTPAPCGPFCLSLGVPFVMNGTAGSGPGPTLTSPCATFGPNAKWFHMVANTTVPATAVISTEGSTYDTIIGVYTGPITSPATLMPVGCNNDVSSDNHQSRLQFQIQPPITNYWLAVDGTNTGDLQLSFWCFQAPQTLAQWNFNNITSPVTNPAPASGSGSLGLTGATAALYASGIGSSDTASPNFAWLTTNYPAQGTGNKTRGIQLRASTAGYQNIALGWDQLVSATASKYFRVQWSASGTNFTDVPFPVSIAAAGVFEHKYVDLSVIGALNNNSNTTLRIVSEWESTAAGTANSNFVTASGGAYSPTGTVSFDMLTLFGTPIPRLTNAARVGNQSSFAVTGPSGYQCVVQASTNLLSGWANLSTNILPATFQETSPSSRRFYRAWSRP